MTTFPRSPRLLKGAIVALDAVTQMPSVIVFQYNPETLTRSLTAQTPAESGDRSDALRLKGAPVENIRFEIELDATDQLEQKNPTAMLMGIHPQLAALEILLYPTSSVVIANTVLLALGTIEVIPPSAPLTLLVWGPSRVLPMRLTEFSVTEEAHDTLLNPVRARVNLGVRVLSYSDLPRTNPGYGLFLSHQLVKETMATIGRLNSLSALTGAIKI